MLNNYFKIALRNLWKHKSYTVINVMGLALGIASSMVIYYIVQYELSFDTFHKHADRIYRITSSVKHGEETHYFNAVPKPLPEAFRQDFAGDIEKLLVVEQTLGRVKIEDETIFIEEAIAFTENGYFTFFDFPLVAGNSSTVLNKPNEVVFSEALSKKLFGSAEHAIGKVFSFISNDRSYELEVTGIMQDLPKNTDFEFKMLISYSSKREDEEYVWDSWNSAFNVYVLLSDNIMPEALTSQFDQFLRKYAGEENVEKANRSLHLQPLEDMHYNEKYPGFPDRIMSKETLAGLILLAGLLVILACVNFVNLATAISTKRSKEVGIRKTLGSSRKQIILHFMGEALFVTLLASLLALCLAELGLVQLKKLYTHLEPVSLQLNMSGVVFFLLLIGIITNVAGFYPGWLLSRFKPVHMFKPVMVVVHRRRFSLRQGLVVFQFFISQVFIVCTLVIAQQLNFVRSAPLGFDENAIITVDLRDRSPQSRERFKTMLSGEAGVENMTFSAFSAISQNMYGGTYTIEGQEEKQASLQFADRQFFDTHGMELLAGTVFTPSDSGSGFVVNESFVQALGLEQPQQALGKFVSVWSFELPIVGVVANYHTNDFGQKIHPLLITNHSPQYGNLSIKVDMSHMQNVIKKLEEAWKLTYPEYTFRYEFLDERVAGFYRDYDRNFSLAQVFAGMAIFIGCLGLYGLVMFMVERKTKEIGIRKVLGASIRHILSFFSKEFIKLVLIAFVLAAPLAYYLMQQWLQNFAYKIEIGFVVYAGSLLFILALVLFTVGYQSVKAALANPVDALRDE